MKTAGVIGIGNMGSGLAKNLIKHGFETVGHDIKEDRMRILSDLGGIGCENAAQVGARAETVFIMVMRGDEVKSVIFDEDGLLTTMSPGSTIILSATITPKEAAEIGEAMAGSGIHLIDSPVSGGYPGAQNGTLTLMAAGTDAAFIAVRAPMEAVSGTIHRVGTEAGQGQAVKACLQSLIGSIFSATFEAAALAAKAGIPGEVLHNVFSTSSAGCVVANTALENIIDRQFEGTGSHISTMYKDLTISLDMARERGVPMHTAAAAMQIFQAGITKYPDGDNWVCTRVIEEIVGAELHRDGGGGA